MLIIYRWNFVLNTNCPYCFNTINIETFRFDLMGNKFVKQNDFSRIN